VSRLSVPQKCQVKMRCASREDASSMIFWLHCEPLRRCAELFGPAYHGRTTYIEITTARIFLNCIWLCLNWTRDVILGPIPGRDPFDGHMYL
jgi:hypothetical protein